MLVRAQGYYDPSPRATHASVSCVANNSASDYLRRFGRNDPLRPAVDHYPGLVTDAVAKASSSGSTIPAHTASSRATNKAREIRVVIGNLVFEINREVSRSITEGSTNTYHNAVNAVRNAPDNFDSDSVQHKYAVRVKEHSQSQQTSDRIVQVSRSSADEIIEDVTADLNQVTAAARKESNRAFNPESIKQAVRDTAENYRGRDSYFAADFIANEVQKAGTIQQLRSKANSAYHSIYIPNPRPDRAGGPVFNYYKIIFSYGKTDRYGPYYYFRVSSSYSDYFENFNRTDFTSGSHRSMGPVVDHYHVMIRDRVVPPYTRELEDLENSDFYRGLDSSEKAALSRAFNDPYYDGQPQYYYDPITSPLDDPELATRNNSKHLEANDILKDELHDRFYLVVSDVAWDVINVARDVHAEVIRQLDNPVDAESVKNSAKKEANRFRTVASRHAAQFVSQRIEGITSSDKDVVVSEVEAAVSDAIAAVTEGASYVADQARDANSGYTSGQLENHIKSYIRSEYPDSHVGHQAAIFIANSDLSGTDTASVVGKIRSAGEKITNAVSLAVGNVSEAASDWESTCSSSCSRHCTDSNCEFEDYVQDFPDRCDGQCTDVSGSCSDDSECCSGSCENGACLDPNAATCGSEGQACCNGDLCSGDLVCSSGTCEVAVVCGSEGEVCCEGNSCSGDLVCSSGTCEVAVVCGSEGSPCCGGNSCSGDLVCDDGTCVDATVSVPADTHSFAPINPGSPVEFPVSNADINCAHIENSKGKNRYNIELVYSWQDSLSINHRIKGELLASAPK